MCFCPPRHLSAIAKATRLVCHGIDQLEIANAGELLAEDLREAQRYLSEITGEFTSDDLLGVIFHHSVLESDSQKVFGHYKPICSSIFFID